MPLYKRPLSLLELASAEVSERVVSLLMVERGEPCLAGRDLREEDGLVDLLVCLGRLGDMLEGILDRLGAVGAGKREWCRASMVLLDSRTRSLRLKPGWVHGQELVTRVPALKQLTHVEVTGAGSDSLLLALARWCPCLHSLYTSYSAEVTDIGLRALSGQHRAWGGDGRGCLALSVLQIIACPSISTAAVVELLLHLPVLAHIAFERLDRVFRSDALFQSNRIYKVQNFEHHHSHLALEPGEQAAQAVEAQEGYFQTLATHCPSLRSVKLSLTSESDSYIRRLASLTRLEEVILDFPGRLGSGFHHFFLAAGARLTQLGLTLREVSARDVQLVSEHCPALRVLHLFFLSFQAESSTPSAAKLFPNLEGLYLGIGRGSSLNLVHTLLTDRLLTSCSRLKTLYLSGVSSRLDDSYLEQKLQQGALSRLENCHVKEEARLGVAAYRSLLKHCPALHRLNVSSWAIPREELMAMQEEATRQNLDLVIIGGKL